MKPLSSLVVTDAGAVSILLVLLRIALLGALAQQHVHHLLLPGCVAGLTTL